MKINIFLSIFIFIGKSTFILFLLYFISAEVNGHWGHGSDDQLYVYKRSSANPASLQKFYQVFGPMNTRSADAKIDSKRIFIPYIFKRDQATEQTNEDENGFDGPDNYQVHVPYFEADNTALE